MYHLTCKTCGQKVSGTSFNSVGYNLEKHQDTCPAILRDPILPTETWEDYRRRKSNFAKNYRETHPAKR